MIGGSSVRRQRVRHFIPLLLPLLWALAASASPDRTLVVANRNVPDSVALAEYYMERRGIPEENLFLVSAPRSETIRWDQYVETVHNPLKAQLLEKRWLQGTPGERRDSEGRVLHTTSGHRIEYLVVCYGVPLRIRHDADRLPEEIRERIPEALRTNRGAVDSELALLSHTAYGINAYLPNPLFERRFPSPDQRASVIRVARLDGPTVEDARRLIDSALEAEENGLRGRAYIDLGGPHPRGDEWLEAVTRRIERLGFDLSVFDKEADLKAPDRFDAPALYFGWYSPNVTGPFTLEGFRFAPGAVALHIHSFSATTARSTEDRWVGPFVAGGAAATVGNVFEPYLELTHRPDLLLEALARGQTLGEAAYYSLPALSWQGVLMGDPLYRPFRVGLDRQLENTGADESGLRQYAVIRRMNLLAARGEREEAIRLGEKAYAEDPRIPLAFALARLDAAGGKADRAVDRLQFIDSVEPLTDLQAGAFLEILAFLDENGAGGLALDGFRRVLEASDLSPPIRMEMLRRAAETALANGSNRLHRQWEAERARLADR